MLVVDIFVKPTPSACCLPSAMIAWQSLLSRTCKLVMHNETTVHSYHSYHIATPAAVFSQLRQGRQHLAKTPFDRLENSFMLSDKNSQTAGMANRG